MSAPTSPARRPALYNLTNQRNWQPSPSLYGNDSLVQNDPRTFELRLQAKF